MRVHGFVHERLLVNLGLRKADLRLILKIGQGPLLGNESIVLLHRTSLSRRCVIFQGVGAIFSKCASVRHVRAAQGHDRLLRAWASA